MSRFGPRILLTIFALVFLAFAAHAGTVVGTVINRTTGKPVPDIPLTLLNPTAGMLEVTSGKSDAQGQFTFTNDAIGMGPILVRATYRDNSFNTFLPPGRPQLEVEVYDTSKDPKTITPASHVIIFQPNGDKLVGAEEFVVQNNSKPAVAYFRTEGNFDFAIPEKATLQQVATIAGAMGMSVSQASIDKGKGLYSIAYAFRPGDTSVRLSYELPYAGSAAILKLPATYPGMKTLVVAPPGVTVSADGLKPAGQEQGMMVYLHDPLAAKAVLTLTISGQGSQQSADSGGGPGNQQEGNSRTGGPEVLAVPGRLDDLKWPLLIGMAALFALSAILLTRKKIIVAPAAYLDQDDAPAPATNPARAPRQKPANPSPAPQPPTPAATVASVDAHVNASLDALKDSLFRLELRRQAGTISDQDYARERAQMEKRLRELVQG
jgi:hypothetical protein